MIIGLLIGGILKGQELIQNAKVTMTARQIQSFKAAYFTFQDSYNALPGDIVNPQNRLSNCTTTPCNVTGNGNGLYDLGSETTNFWLHMANANLITGIDTSLTNAADLNPKSPFGGLYFLGSGGSSPYLYLMDSNTIGILTNHQAAQIDRKLDDGKQTNAITAASDNGECEGVGINGADYAEDRPEAVCTLYIQFLQL